MKFYILTLFPEIINTYASTSIIGRALASDSVTVTSINIRDFTTDLHHTVDDKPYGGGAGMVMKADILEKALFHAFSLANISPDYDKKTSAVLITSASGQPYSQKIAREITSLENIFIVCGHYEGIDYRFIEQYADFQISIGPYVLTGGELPSLVILDSVTRLIPGVLGNAESLIDESFNTEFDLEYPHYTRPAVFNGVPVPEVLTSGDHAKIAQWKKENTQR